MSMKIRGRLAAALLLAALGAGSAHAQYSADPGVEAFLIAGAMVPESNNPGRFFSLKEGDQIEYQGTTFVLGPEGLKLPGNVPIKVKRDGQTYDLVTPTPRHSLHASLFPLAVFSVAGQLLDAKTNQYVGGTVSVGGAVVSVDGVYGLDHGRRAEVGVFFFQPYQRGKYGDLYQISGRYFPNRHLGFQIGYIDSTTALARSLSAHVLFEAEAGGIAGKDAGRLNFRLGVGTLSNFTDTFQPASNQYFNRDSINFSSFVQVSYTIARGVDLLASEWYVRDRTNDVHRFGLGLSYKF